MLYDPKWEKTETRADPFKLETLIAWLEKQPAEQSYSYGCAGHCLLAQYFTAQGFKNVVMGITCWMHADGHPDLDPVFDRIACGPPAAEYFVTPGPHHTFGAALERARQAARRA